MCDLDKCTDHAHMPPIKLADEKRRQFLQGLIALPLATVLYFPELAAAQAGKVKRQTLNFSGKSVDYGLAMPKNPKSAPAVVLVHEWWGLNNQILSVAQEYANLGFIALAVDLYNGKVATDGTTARNYMQALDGELARQQMAQIIKHGKKLGNGKVGTVGWCFGGAWSLNGSLVAGVDATVIYYGSVAGHGVGSLKKLKGPVMGHFGLEDGFINPAMVNPFADQMKEAGKKFESFWYPAGHGFANPTSARYDEPSTKLAWDRTLDFYKKNLF